ncbi:MAG: hypothetical protein HY425_03580 [Candidatus Levybacteria bacterium]|nr:hypothetical protein [Candidatus Levybacteria bacterium]
MKEAPKQFPKDAFGLEGKAWDLGHGTNLIYVKGHTIDPLRILTETDTDPAEAAKAVNDFDQLGKELKLPSIVEALKSEGRVRSGKQKILIMGANEIITTTSDEAVNNSIGFTLGFQIANVLRKTTPQNPKYESPTCAIAGSFRFKPDIDALIGDINAQEISVLAPPKGNVMKKKDDFKILEGNLDLGEADIEAAFIQEMSEADALYIYAKDGYIGRSVKAELRFAIECGIPIFVSEPLKVNIGKYDIGKNGRNIGREIAIMPPSEFSNLMKEDDTHKKTAFKKQFWYREPKGRLRIFGFTDDRLIRALFVDMRDVYIDPVDVSMTIKRISRTTDLLAVPSYCVLSNDR